MSDALWIFRSKNSLIKTLVLVSLALGQSCSISIYQATNRFETAETSGHRKNTFRFGFTGTDQADFGYTNAHSTPKSNPEMQKINNDEFRKTDRRTYSSRETRLSEYVSIALGSLPSLGRDIGLGINYGHLENLDFGFRTSVFTPYVFSSKYQFIGKSRNAANKEAIAGNFSLATSVGVGGITEDIYIGSTPTNKLLIDFALISSYRISDQVGIYTGPFVTFQRIWGKREIENVYSKPFDGYPFDARMLTTGVHLGFDLMGSETLSVLPEVSYTISRSGTSSLNGVQWGLYIQAGN